MCRKCIWAVESLPEDQRILYQGGSMPPFLIRASSRRFSASNAAYSLKAAEKCARCCEAVASLCAKYSNIFKLLCLCLSNVSLKAAVQNRFNVPVDMTRVPHTERTHDMTRIALTFGALTLLAAPAFAQMTLMDADENGTYSMEEMLMAYPDMTEDTFAAIDTDESGEVSIEELATAQTEGLLPPME
jgi:hypothetical protein